MARFRFAFKKLVPWWLQQGEGELVLYSLGVVLEAAAERMRQALYLRWPDHAPEDALGNMGRDRKIVRGLEEPSTSYRARLKRWLTDHKSRGGPKALLRQVGAFWDFATNGPYQMALISRYGRCYERDTAGTITRSQIAWNPDSEPERWARLWFIFHWHENIDDDGAWGDPGDWGDGGVWGSGMSGALARQLRLVPHEWVAGHVIGRIGLLGPDAELWGYPAGTWGDPGVWGGGSYTEIDL